MDENINYVPIGIDVLVDGLYIDYSIYYKLNDEFILLCKDVLMTNELILRLQNLASYYIYVPSHLKNKIVNKSSLIKAVQEITDLQNDFKKIKEATTAMFSQVADEGKISIHEVDSITEKLESKLEKVDNSLIIQYINGIRSSDEYLYNHSVNVALLNGLMGRWLDFNEESIEKLVKIGFIHDIGKVKVSKKILQKPAKLTDEEFEEMKKHPVYSLDLLVNSGEVDKEILEGVAQHHEKVNGRGYPYKLKSDEISAFARITAVSDVYDAMVAKRVYKDPHSPFQILSSFSEDRYSELDINYINVFLNRMPEELVGKAVMLSNGSVGTVAFVNPSDYEHPLVELDGTVIKTDDKLNCVSMYLGKKEMSK